MRFARYCALLRAVAGFMLLFIHDHKSARKRAMGISTRAKASYTSARADYTPAGLHIPRKRDYTARNRYLIKRTEITPRAHCGAAKKNYFCRLTALEGKRKH
jgi:hypothetical protein